MIKKLFLLITLLAVLAALSAAKIEWGIKYGAGVSSIHGSDLNYNRHYEITETIYDTLSQGLGYLQARSNQQKPSFSQNFGLFATIPLTGDRNLLLLQPEILWQRYTYSYWYRDAHPESDDFVLQWMFPDQIDGFVDAKLDYVTVPVLFKLQQDSPEDEKENHAIVSMYGYFGPSFSFLLKDKLNYRGGILDFDQHVAEYMDGTTADPDTTRYYSAALTPASQENLIKTKYDLVFGFGWNLRDALKIGWGSDEWVIDARFNLNVNPLGDGNFGNNFKLYNALLSLGYKF